MGRWFESHGTIREVQDRAQKNLKKVTFRDYTIKATSKKDWEGKGQWGKGKAKHRGCLTDQECNLTNMWPALPDVTVQQSLDGAIWRAKETLIMQAPVGCQESKPGWRKLPGKIKGKRGHWDHEFRPEFFKLSHDYLPKKPSLFHILPLIDK